MVQKFKNEFFSKDVVVCDLIWTHPDITDVHHETIRDPEFDDVYISYQIFKYPADRVNFQDTKPVFIYTKRGCVMPKLKIFKTRGGAFNHFDKEKEKWQDDVENFRTLLVIGKVART